MGRRGKASKAESVAPQPAVLPKGGALQWVGGLWRDYVVAGVAAEEAKSFEHIDGREPGKIHWKILSVLVLAAISLTLLEYLGKSNYYWDYVHSRGLAQGTLEVLKMRFMENPGAAPRGWHLVEQFTRPIREKNSPEAQLSQLLYWAGVCFVSYFLIPALFVVAVLREKLSSYGLTLKGTLKHMWVYLLMFSVILPLVYLVSASPAFQQQYPFYGAAARNPLGFWVWELAYAVQFLSLEFFFRGFLLHGTKERFGAYSVMVMVVPYCMIHYGKPMPETFGAIIAGTVLGLLSLRTGSIILGFMIHVSVALTMDLTSLWRKDQLGPIIDALF